MNQDIGIGKCCFCNDDCNPFSQACSICARSLFFMTPNELLQKHSLDNEDIVNNVGDTNDVNRSENLFEVVNNDSDNALITENKQ